MSAGQVAGIGGQLPLRRQAERILARREVVPAGAALALLVLDWIPPGVQRPSGLTLLASAVITVCVGLSGWYPRLAGGAALVVTAVVNALPSDVAVLTAPAIGSVLVIGGWVARRWNLAVLVAGTALLAGSVIGGDPDRVRPFVAWSFQIVVGVGVGLVVRLYKDRLQVADEQVGYWRLRVEAEDSRVRSVLAAQLHDSVVACLARIVVNTEYLIREPSRDRTQVCEEQILADAQSAMRQIRQIIHASTPAAEAVRDDGSWVAVLKEYRTLLAAAGLELRPSVPSEQELAEVLDGPRLSVLAVALREGCLNALKYAGRGTSVRVQVVLDPDQVELMVRSTTAPSGTPEEAWRRGLEGGMGLTMLTRRAEQVGGYVSYGPLKDDWLLGVALPYPAAGVGTDHGTDEVPLDKEKEHD